MPSLKKLSKKWVLETQQTKWNSSDVVLYVRFPKITSPTRCMSLQVNSVQEMHRYIQLLILELEKHRFFTWSGPIHSHVKEIPIWSSSFRVLAAAPINSLEGRLKFGLREFSLVMFASVLTPFLFPVCHKSNLNLWSDNQKSVMTSKTVPSITTKETLFIEFHSPHNEEK